jgi:hypothetical protein
MQRIVDSALPGHMRDQARVANFIDQCLTLHVQSPAMATRLRLSLDSLRNTLQAAGQAVAEIKVKVRSIPFAGNGYAELSISRRISGVGRESLLQLSDGLKQDDPLAQALRRMVERSA